MRAPESLQTLIDYGVLDEVVRPLMSGKEAQVYVVVAGGRECVAKVYKEAMRRNFKQRTEYTEGRRTRNTRDQRAMQKRTKHGRQQDESAWRNTEVDMIYRLRDAGVRVPEPINYVDGVLVMELVEDAEGHPASRLGDLEFTPAEAAEIHDKLIREVIRMLCAGVIHGDLSEFNVLVGVDGPVLIDFPQSVDPASNPSAGKLLLRDVENLDRFLARFSPGRRVRLLGPEIWSLFQANRLKPDTKLTGTYQAPQGKANTDEVFALIEDARLEAQRRSGSDGWDEDLEDAREAPSLRRAAPSTSPSAAAPAPLPRPRRVFVDFSKEARPARKPAAKPPRDHRGGASAAPDRAGAKAKRDAASAGPQPTREGARTGPGRGEGAESPSARRKRRRSRRPRTGIAPAGEDRAETRGAQRADDRGEHGRKPQAEHRRGLQAEQRRGPRDESRGAARSDAGSGNRGDATRGVRRTSAPAAPGTQREDAGSGARSPRRRRRRRTSSRPTE